MKNFLFPLFATIFAALSFSSCNTTSGQGAMGGLLNGGSQGSQSVLESLLSSLIGDAVPVTEQMLNGTWQYASPEVRFDSENALTKAGGEVAASQVEAKLAEVYASMGIKPGAFSFSFADNHSCTLNLGGKSVTGTYTLDSKNHSFGFRSNTGLISLNGKIYTTGGSLAVLFDAKKLLSIAQTLSMMTGQGNSTIGTLSALLNQYEGMMLGMNLKK